MVWNRAITITALIGGLLALLAGIAAGSGLAAVLAALFFAFSLLVWKYGYLLIPAFTRATHIVEIRGGYEIPPGRDLVMKKAEGGYYATKFLEVRFYESAIEKNTSEKRTMFESFEKAIASLKYIVKISLLVSAIDLSKHIDEIKTKRSSAETKRSKLPGKSDELIRIDREIAMWNRLLDRITHGERPVELLAFASTTAFGLTKEEASSRVRRQAKEVRTILSSSLGCDVRELIDRDMLKCFEWDLFFPTTREDIRDELF
jgi:hypothetical protein